MAVTINNSVAIGGAGGGTSLETASFALGGTDRVLYVLAGSGAGSVVAPSAVRWGGAAGTMLTQISTSLQFSTYGIMEIWRLIAPAAQTATVYASWPSSQDERWLIGVALEGAHQTTPNPTPDEDSGTGYFPSLDVAATAGDFVLGFLSGLDQGGSSPTVTSSQTSIQELEAGAISAYEVAAASYTTAAGNPETMDWSMSNGFSWGAIGFPVAESAGGGGGSVLPLMIAGAQQ